MSPRQVSDLVRPLPYQDLYNPSFHHGAVAVTGTRDIDLGIKHANFSVVGLNVKGAQAALETDPGLAWNHIAGKPGQFRISVSKLDVAGSDTDPATAELTVSFFAIADAPVA